MVKKIEIPEIKIVSFVGYSQVQALKFGLNHTQAIIMNYMTYVLPHFADEMVIGGEKYFWATLSKPLNDMPTLKVAEKTMRTHINSLISEGILDRKIKTVGGKSRAYYRVTDKWLKDTYGYPADFTTLYNIIKSKLDNGEISKKQIESTINLFSSYQEEKVEKVRKPTTYNLDGIKGSDIVNLIVEELGLSEKGEGVEIDVEDHIDEDYIEEHIINQIWINGEKMGWLRKDNRGKMSRDTEGEVYMKVKTMFDWHKKNKVPIKDFKGKINTFFGKHKLVR